MNSSWQPLYSIDRSGITEVTIHGALCVVEGREAAEHLPEPLLAVGDTASPLWTRSLLKPWQLLSHLAEVKQNYPQLARKHLAIMMASHSAEPLHLEILQEIMDATGAQEEWLRCPKTYPHSAEQRRALKEQGVQPRRLYHNCSGKHFGYLLAIKAEDGAIEKYLDFEGSHFKPLREILAKLLHKNSDNLPATTDGCQLPNYAVSIYEMASLYQGLANGHGIEADGGLPTSSTNLLEVRDLMLEYPKVVGGSDRLDSKLMAGLLPFKSPVAVIAKEGADGLLGIGVSASERYPNGLGILIKVSSGFDAKEMEILVREIFMQLGMIDEADLTPAQLEGARKDHVNIRFHFKIASRERATVCGAVR